MTHHDKSKTWLEVLKHFNWEIWDVSDYTTYDETYISFVGSKAEASKLYPKLKKDFPSRF